MGFRLAIIGATGLVGHEMMEIIGHEQAAIDTIGLYASAASAGRELTFPTGKYIVSDLAQCDFSRYHAAFFCVGDELSAKYVPKALEQGCAVVDKSNAYRLAPDVPLLVPRVNDDALKDSDRLVANPNCTTIVLLHALAPVHRKYGLKSIWVASYQSISGAGREAADGLLEQTRDAHVSPGLYSRPEIPSRHIAYNVHAGIGRVDEHGRCGEENKLVEESRKILGLPGLPIVAHTARVPVLVGHSMAVTFELEEAAGLDGLADTLDKARDVRLMERENPAPVTAALHRQVEVGRLRREPGLKNGWSCFICGDNLNIGAALNGWRIMELLRTKGVLSRQSSQGA